MLLLAVPVALAQCYLHTFYITLNHDGIKTHKEGTNLDCNMCPCETSVGKGQANLLVHTKADSYPHPGIYFPTKTSSHRTHPTGSQADKLKIPACVTEDNCRTTTLKKQTQIHKTGSTYSISTRLIIQVMRFPQLP